MKKAISLLTATLALLMVASLVQPAWALQGLSGGAPTSGPGSGTVTNVSGTTNQIVCTNPTTMPVCSIAGLAGVAGAISVTGTSGNGGDFINGVCKDGICPVTAFGAACSNQTATCTATASNAVLSCPGGVADFGTAAHGPNASVYVPHGGTLQTLTTPTAPTVTAVSRITNETTTISGTSYTVAQTATFKGIIGIAYNSDTTGKKSQLVNVGTLTPGQAEFTVSSAGVITFNAADTGRAIIVAYYYGDTSGGTTYTETVAALDAFGGESAAPSVTTITNGNATTNVNHFPLVQWPSLNNKPGYAVYRNSTLVAKVDELQTWTRRMLYRVGDIVLPPTPNSHMYIATQDGYSGDSAPSFPTGGGATVTETPDSADSNDGTLGVQWTEDGTPTVSFQDNGVYGAAWMTGGLGGTVYEPNVSATPPASVLADAFVSPISSVGSTSITLTNAPITSATSVPVAHDDTAAYQASFNLLTTSNIASLNITVPEGVCRVSSPITIASSAYPNFSLTAINGTGDYGINQPYGSQNYQLSSATHQSPGGGSIIQALDATPAILDLSNGGASNSPGPTITNITFLGYGVGQQIGLNTQFAGVGAYSHFDNDEFLDLYTGLNYQMQFSDMKRPLFYGDHYGLLFAAAGTGTNQNNNLTVANALMENDWVGAVIRNGGGIVWSGGNYENDRTDFLLSSGSVDMTGYFGESGDFQQYYGWTALDVFSCDRCFFHTNSVPGNTGGTITGGIPPAPAIFFRGGKNTTFQSTQITGDIHIAIANPASTYNATSTVLRDWAQWGATAGFVNATSAIRTYLDGLSGPSGQSAAYLDASTTTIGNCHTEASDTSVGCAGVGTGSNGSFAAVGLQKSSGGGAVVFQVQTNDKTNLIVASANGTLTSKNSTLDDSGGDMKVKGYYNSTTAAGISGGGALSTGSNAFAGRITGLAATSNVLTPGFTCPNAVTCSFEDDTTVGGVKVTAQAVGTITFSATASDTTDYICGCR